MRLLKHCFQPAIWLIIVVINLSRVVAFAQTNIQNPPPRQNEERLAMQYFQQRDFEKAAQILQHLFTNEKKPYLYSYYFLSLTELNRFDEAQKAARQMQKQFPGQPAWLVDEAYVYQLLGNTRKAERMIKKLIEEALKNQQSVVQTANAFRTRGMTAQALETYQRGKKLFPDPNAMLSEIASVYEMAGDFHNAIDTYLTLLAAKPQMLDNIKGRLQFSLAQDIENERSTYLKKKLLATVQRDPDNQQLSQLLMWYSIQTRDFQTAFRQAKALDARFRNDGTELLRLAQISASDDDQATALEALDYVIKKYPNTNIYREARFLRVSIKYDQLSETPEIPLQQAQELEQELRQNLTDNPDSYIGVEITSMLANVLAFYTNQADEAINLLESVVKTGLAQGKLKMDLGDIYLHTGRVWDANLMYAQAARESHDDEQGQEALFRQARLSYFIGEFEWAKAQLDVLKSATSRLIANDAMELSLLIGGNMDADSSYTMLSIVAKADLRAHRKEYRKALALLDSTGTALLDHPIQDEVLLKKAALNAHLGQYSTADSLYRLLYNFFPEGIWAGKALIERARLLDHFMLKPKEALPLYELIINRFGSSFYADEARRRYREITTQFPPSL